MKNLILLTVTTFFILVILITEKQNNVEVPKNLASSDSSVNNNKEEIDESVWDDYDWKTIVTDKNATMKLTTPFAKDQDAELEMFNITIQKQKGASYKPTIEFSVPQSIDIKKGLDFQFFQMTNIDDIDTTIADSDGSLHLELSTNTKGESSAILKDGAIKLPNNNTYDFIKKCNSYNQLMVEFHYKSGEEKSILIQLVTFTENYRVIE